MFSKKIMNFPSIQKQNGFTAIRILCALIVVYEHIVVLLDLSIPCIGIRRIAVNVFFIISGFWVTRSYFTSKSLKEFYKKRVKKIFPLYLIILYIFAIFLSFFSTYGFISYFTDSGFWKYLLANTMTLNFIHPDLPGVFNGSPVNGSLWTIKIELGFYLFLPLIIFLCIDERKDRLNSLRCVIVLFIAYLISVLYIIIIPYFINKFHLSLSFSNQLPAYISYFVTGMFCFFFYEELFPLWNKLIIPCSLVFFICFMVKIPFFSVLFEPVVLGVIIMWCALKCKPLFIFSKIYDFSYFLYLIHYPIIMIIREFVC